MAHTNHLSASAHHLSSYVLMTIDLCFWKKKQSILSMAHFFPCIRASFIIIIIVRQCYLQIVFYRAIRVLQCYSAQCTHIWWNISTYFGHWNVARIIMDSTMFWLYRSKFSVRMSFASVDSEISVNWLFFFFHIKWLLPH